MGNKTDLRYEAQVKTKEGLDLAKKLSEEIGTEVSFIETSAIKGENVQEAFSTLAQNMASFFSKKSRV